MFTSSTVAYTIANALPLSNTFMLCTRELWTTGQPDPYSDYSGRPPVGIMHRKAIDYIRQVSLDVDVNKLRQLVAVAVCATGASLSEEAKSPCLTPCRSTLVPGRMRFLKTRPCQSRMAPNLVFSKLQVGFDLTRHSRLAVCFKRISPGSARRARGQLGVSVAGSSPVDQPVQTPRRNR